MLAPGYKADLNLIDHAALKIRRPEMTYYLPGGGGRIVQRTEGYVATSVPGVMAYSNGSATGKLTSRLVRGASAAPVNGVP